MFERQIHFVGGEKGGVGKSVVARLLAQYWIDGSRAWKGFDTDRSHGALLRYYEGFADALEISKVEELDAIIETAINGEPNVLVDLAAQTEEQLHNWVEEGDVLELARDLGVRICFWYVMDEGKDSINLLSRIIDRHGDNASYVVVLNYGRGDDFTQFRSSAIAERIAQMQVPIIEIKALHRPVMRKIDQFDKSFWAALNNTDPAEGQCLSLMERQRIKRWLKNAYSEFDRIEA